MVRINLLPRDILEKRRYERYFVWVYAAAAIIVVVLLAVWLFLGLQVRQKSDDLQSRQELANQLRADADAFAVFEEKQSDLDARKSVAATALTGRINWSKVSTEISMVLPSDMWVNSLSANQDTGLQLQGTALDKTESPDMGQKSVARTMVRLNDLEDLFDVWLTSSAKGVRQEGESKTDVLEFVVTSQVVKPASASAAASSSVPAPPAPTGQ